MLSSRACRNCPQSGGGKKRHQLTQTSKHFDIILGDLLYRTSIQNNLDLDKNQKTLSIVQMSDKNICKTHLDNVELTTIGLNKLDLFIGETPAGSHLISHLHL